MDITGTWIWRIQAQMMSLKHQRSNLTGKLSWSYALATRMGEQHFKGSKRFLFFVWLVDLLQFCGILWRPSASFHSPRPRKNWQQKEWVRLQEEWSGSPKAQVPQTWKALCVNSKEQRLQLGHGFGIPLSVELNMYVWFIHNYNLIMCYSKAILVHVIIRNFTF